MTRDRAEYIACWPNRASDRDLTTARAYFRELSETAPTVTAREEFGYKAFRVATVLRARERYGQRVIA